MKHFFLDNMLIFCGGFLVISRLFTLFADDFIKNRYPNTKVFKLFPHISYFYKAYIKHSIKQSPIFIVGVLLEFLAAIFVAGFVYIYILK